MLSNRLMMICLSKFTNRRTENRITDISWAYMLPLCRLGVFQARTSVFLTMDKQVIRNTKKSRQTANKTQIRDVFTVICKTDLGVECVKEYKFHPDRRWRFDYAFPEYKIALEVEGGVWTQGRHTRAQGFLGDIEKYNTATLMGWRVFRTTPTDLYRTATVNLLKAAIKAHFVIK